MERRLDVTASVEDIQEAYSKIPEAAKAKVKALGLPLAVQPLNNEGQPEDISIPQDITVVGDQELGSLFTRLTSLADYVQERLSEADNDRMSSKNARTAVFAKIKQLKEGDPSERTDQARIDRRYLDTDRIVIEAECFHSLVDAIMKKCNRGLRLVSREITRRQDEDERSKRGESIGNLRKKLQSNYDKSRTGKTMKRLRRVKP